MKYDLEKRVFLNEKFIKTQNIALVQSSFKAKYRSKQAPSRSTILNINKNYINTGSVGRKQIIAKKRTVRTDDLIKSIKNLFLEDRKLSLRKAANLMPASISTIRIVARKDLKFRPFKFTKTFKLYPQDYAKRVNFAKFVKSKRLNLETSFICSDEAHFYLHGGHNVQNDRIWARFGPEELVQQPLHDDKVTVWCAFSAKKCMALISLKKMLMESIIWICLNISSGQSIGN